MERFIRSWGGRSGGSGLSGAYAGKAACVSSTVRWGILRRHEIRSWEKYFAPGPLSRDAIANDDRGTGIGSSSSGSSRKRVTIFACLQPLSKYRVPVSSKLFELRAGTEFSKGIVYATRGKNNVISSKYQFTRTKVVFSFASSSFATSLENYPWNSCSNLFVCLNAIDYSLSDTFHIAQKYSQTPHRRPGYILRTYLGRRDIFWMFVLSGICQH